MFVLTFTYVPQEELAQIETEMVTAPHGIVPDLSVRFATTKRIGVLQTASAPRSLRRPSVNLAGRVSVTNITFN